MYEDDNNSDDGQMMIFETKQQHKANKYLSQTAQKLTIQAVQNSQKICNINNHLDPYNKAQKSQLITQIEHKIDYTHYFIKNKYKNQKTYIFDQLTQLLQSRGYNNISTINDRQQQQIMIVRIVSKIQGSLNTVIIQDKTHRDKLLIKQGIIWIGMIVAIKVKWIEGMYKLQKIIDLNMPINNNIARLSAKLQVNRIMLIKGPFRRKFTNQDQGIRVITKQLQKLRKNNIYINQIIIMGPILSKNNRNIQNCTIQRTYQQQYQYIITNLRRQINKIDQSIYLYIIPSIDDIVSMYPIPQPAIQIQQNKKYHNNIKYLSNPSSLKLYGKRVQFNIDFINYDVLKYIDTHKIGKAIKPLKIQNIQTYFKQTFYLNNTTNSNQPFDQNNLHNLYNKGKFGQFVVFSSNFYEPFVQQINGRFMINIGSLGMEVNEAEKNFIVLMSVYQGEGSVVQRTKVETISLKM